ncbi:hypothetical protein COCCADRAFT_42315 [Bipolaris zeicola 26-R-13]|uniref:Uncharacterized protein n=1 Tax=Cochliobolus carbonum (strain 26-R-13) TaxID=930089 RepID=W6XMV2_COCC2|nr:uncharacterized protein COCCADRAFT_42315 [Bipolaris zeicola 26-R-13]EUC26610.1 hypothetical protein COCCADRAFT_42315 [Bipolaris zeicola 26-R-13]
MRYTTLTLSLFRYDSGLFRRLILKDKQISSIVIAFKSEEEAKKIGSRITILGESLRVEKYRQIPPTAQCSKCQGFRHNFSRYKNTASCYIYKVKGKACNYTLPKCKNCKQTYFANSKDCEVLLSIK